MATGSFVPVDLDAILDELELRQDEHVDHCIKDVITGVSEDDDGVEVNDCVESVKVKSTEEDLNKTSIQSVIETVDTVETTTNTLSDEDDFDIYEGNNCTTLLPLSESGHMSTVAKGGDSEEDVASTLDLEYATQVISSTFESIYDVYRSDDSVTEQVPSYEVTNNAVSDAFFTNINETGAYLKNDTTNLCEAEEHQETLCDVQNSRPNSLDVPPLLNLTQSTEDDNNAVCDKRLEDSESRSDEKEENGSLFTADEVISIASPSVAETVSENARSPSVSSSIESSVVEQDLTKTSNLTHLPPYLQGLDDDQLSLGVSKPWWVPDADAVSCMICNLHFTLVKRRHHCRSCGKVLCSSCCSDRHPLPYLDGKSARICKPCKTILQRLYRAGSILKENVDGTSTFDSSSLENECHDLLVPQIPSTNCSVVPGGVLKRSSSASLDADGSSLEGKQVTFSDGIRPGIEEEPRYRMLDAVRRHRASRNTFGTQIRRSSGPVGASNVARSLLPLEGLPCVKGYRGQNLSSHCIAQMLDSDKDHGTVCFSLNKNLQVNVKKIFYGPANSVVWNYWSRGLNSVGQDEIIVLLVKKDDEAVPPRDIFDHFQQIYEEAGRGNPVVCMSYTLIQHNSTLPFLGNKELGGFLFIRRSLQCVQNIGLYSAPSSCLFALVLTKLELPWARICPLRLMLRLGAQFRYYPAPLWSVRDRPTVYGEIGSTIMKILNDFRNFAYQIPQIDGVVIHMEYGFINILVPKSSYKGVVRALDKSNEAVFSLAARFSPTADAHLVAVQRDVQTDEQNEKVEIGTSSTTSDYITQAITITNSIREVTGASFVVFSGALKSSSGLTAKSTIVEDGVMVQISAEKMLEVRQRLREMQDVEIPCGLVGNVDETVKITWTERDVTVNVGVKSCLDGLAMDGIPSARIRTPIFISSHGLQIRWTEFFLWPSESEVNPTFVDQPDPSQMAERLAKAACKALGSCISKLMQLGCNPLAIRFTLDPDKVCYEAGSNGEFLSPEFMKYLDEYLVSLIHYFSDFRCKMELIFYILEH